MPRTLDLAIFVLTDKTDCFTPCCACTRGVMNALECRTLTAKCMTLGIVYSMAVTIIYP
jgi:hypothetical protein